MKDTVRRKQRAKSLVAQPGGKLQRQVLEQHFHYATEHARDIILLFDETGRLVQCNDAAQVAYGYTREELLQLTLSELRAAQARAAIPADLESAARPGGATFETVERRKDGSSFPAEASMHLIEIEGRVFYQSIIRDITERKKFELTLLREAKRLRVLMETAIDGIHIVDQNGCLAEANPAFLRMLGYENDEAIGLHVTDWDVQVSREELPARIASLLTRSEVFETQFRRKDGTILDVELSISALEIEGVIWFYCAGRDITDRKRAEAALRESEQQFRALVEQSIAGIVIIKDAHFTYLNPRAAEIFGYAQEELTGEPVTMVIAEEDHALVAENLRKRVAGEVKSLQYTFRSRRKDGTIITVATHGTRATIEDRPVIIAHMQDASQQDDDRRRIEGYVHQLRAAMLGTVQAISMVVELRDPYTAGHEKRVGALARTIGIELGLSEETCTGLEVTGMVHDIGKVAVPAEFLSKPGRLTAMEFAIIKGHPQLGYDAMKDIAFPWPLAETILQHHERLDGSGYPRGLKGDQIILEARILAVADVVEAMASHRPYRPALGIEAALDEITQFRGVRYDAQVVDACLRLFREKYYRLPEHSRRAGN